MICSYCQRTRNDTTAPCPYCGTPAQQVQQIEGWEVQGNWGDSGQSKAAGQVPFEASPFSYSAQNLANPEQQSWDNRNQGQAPQWNQAPPNGSPARENGQQIQQPSWNSIQNEWDQAQQASLQPSWVGTPQDQQPQGWNTPQQVSPSLNAPQWEMPQQISPSLNTPPQDQQYGWNMPQQVSPSLNAPQWGMPQQQSPQQGWSTPSQDLQNWNSPQPTPYSPSQQQQSPANTQMGLVPYQGNMELQASSSRTSMLQILPADIAERMLPAIPQEDMAVYVPPMYTKPRAIIPRYRAISGLLSIIIVSLMLCTGAGYAAKATGTLDTLGKIVTGDSHPTPLAKTTTNTLPEPTTLIDRGPAYGIIYSATTAANVDPNTGLPIQEQHIFTINQLVHVTYAIKSAKPGTVQIQWFSNGNPLTTPNNMAFDPKDSQNKHADAAIPYQLPAEGWVDLKWNNQLAMRLYFVVRA